MTITLDYTSGATKTVTTVAGEVGVYQWKQIGGPTGGLPATFNTFCIELLQDISPGTSYFDYSATPLAGAPNPGLGLQNGTGPMSATQADDLSALWAQYTGNINSVDGSATFQFAIWDILYGTQNLTYTPYSSGSSANLSMDVSTAARWATLKTATTPGGQAGFLDTSRTAARQDLVALSSPTAQDQITEGLPGQSPSGPTAAPLPSAAEGGLALLGGLGLLAGYRRKSPVTQLDKPHQ